MTPTIELDALTVRFGNRVALDALSGSFSARALGLLGPNGAGKSTLLATLLGFHVPDAGHVRVLGLDPRRGKRALFEQIGYMPESDAFIADMTAVHFVRYMAELSGLPAQSALERAHEALVSVGLGEARYRKLGTYSIGMKQSVKLAQAIVHAPALLLLDEPTNGLDPAARHRMIQLIREIRDSGLTRLIISSHLLHDVEECCDEVLILKQGRIQARANLEAQRASERKFLEFETSRVDDGFLAAVQALGCDCACFPASGGASRLRVILGENVQLRALYELAQRNGLLIRRMSIRRDSLEEIFLDAMRQPEPELMVENTVASITTDRVAEQEKTNGCL